MISITSAQLDAWLALFIFPLSRILGLLATAPVFNNAALPVRMRLIAGLAITLALAPALPPLPALPASSWLGLIVLGQQILIGVLLGFALRITFAAVDVAGELIGLQMGLSFATFFDPTSGGQTPVVDRVPRAADGAGLPCPERPPAGAERPRRELHAAADQHHAHPRRPPSRRCWPGRRRCSRWGSCSRCR
jgi:hypothetical protein